MFLPENTYIYPKNAQESKTVGKCFCRAHNVIYFVVFLLDVAGRICAIQIGDLYLYLYMQSADQRLYTSES